MAKDYKALIRNKLSSKIFAPNTLSGDATLKKPTITYNDRGEEDSVTYTTSTIQAVVYNAEESRLNYEAFGDLIEGALEAVVPYDTSVEVKDTLEVEGTDYRVTSIDPNYLAGGSTAKILLLTKKHA